MFQVGKAPGATALVSLLVVACGSEPRATEEMARARLLVQQADAANVHRYAAAELNQARDKLQEAERADGKDKHDLARQSANQAAADAELATALARSREAEQAAGEQEKSLETLRQEAKQGISPAKSND